jgi:hypothetical protein
MPNPQNISSPITMVGNGRSGTSLVSRILAGHPDCRFVGETVNLIHSVVKSQQSSLPEKRWKDIPEAIRQQFLQLFPSPQPRWMQKPIGLPIVAKMFPSEEEFIRWYWDVFQQVFPDACYLTVLRHPLDIVISSHNWWGDDFASIIERNRLVAEIIKSPFSKVQYAVDYHALVLDPKREVEKLLDFVKLDFHQDCLAAVDVGHVVHDPASNQLDQKQLMEQRRRESFSHREHWPKIDAGMITESYRTAIENCWHKFGCDFGGWQ